MKKWLSLLIVILFLLASCEKRTNVRTLKNISDEKIIYNNDITQNYNAEFRQIVLEKNKYSLIHKVKSSESRVEQNVHTDSIGVQSNSFLKINQKAPELSVVGLDKHLKPPKEFNNPLVKNNASKDVVSIFQNNVDLIWADMTSPNTGWTSNMPSNFKQFKGPLLRNIKRRSDNSINEQNFWFEIEEAGDGSNCSSSINKAKNTVVEIGWSRFYFLMHDDRWVLANETKDQIINGNGAAHPHSGSQPQFGFGKERCNRSTDYFHKIQKAHTEYKTDKKFLGKFTKAKPNWYYRYHGWANQAPLDLSKVKAVFGQTYMRLVVDNTDLPDDRHLASYVGHVGTDSWLKGATPYYRGGNSVSRYKIITNNWQSFNVFSGNYTGAKGTDDHFTKEQLERNPPPFKFIP